MLQKQNDKDKNKKTRHTDKYISSLRQESHHNQLPVRIYRPIKQTLWDIHVWKEMVAELVSCRELIWRLFLRDFNARYRQSVLGILWVIIMPLVAVGTFVLLNHSGILNIGQTAIPYPAFALLGLTVWQLFAGGLGACSNAILAGGSMVVKINFPKETLVIAAMGQTFVEMMVRLLLLIVVFGFYGIAPAWTVVFFLFVLIPLMLLTLGLGFVLALFNVILRDIGHTVTLATTFLLFLTPVLYPKPLTGILAILTKYNPLAVFVATARDLIIIGHLTQPVQFTSVSILSVIIFIFSWRIFHLAEKRMAERIGAR
jgi:lipopolysaccharide transport system permease protein